MDLIDAMNFWTKLGGEFISWDKGEGKPYITLFVWEGKVEGNCTAHPGSGFSWDWPERLMDEKIAEDERREEEDQKALDDYEWERENGGEQQALEDMWDREENEG